MSDNSMNWSLTEIAQACDAKLIGDDISIAGISTDSRTVGRDELFVALHGPNFDGHDYADKAIVSGAAALLVERELDNEVPQILVNNTLAALGLIAQAWRAKHKVKLVAITGSNGKTTVKEMITSILDASHSVLATKGNLNNDIGVPLTLFRLRQEHEFAVIEMGANHHGEIDYLTHIAQPDVAVITNAGAAHLEGFGSIEGVSRAKGEIYSGLADNGTAVINHDDKYYAYWHELNRERSQISFGLNEGADVSCQYKDTSDGSDLGIAVGKQKLDVRLGLPGKHNVLNALAAASVAIAFDINYQDIKTGLEKLSAVPGRLQMLAGRHGSRVIDDTYNANPSSLGVAINVLQKFPGHHYLALGDMGELGNDAEQMHEQMGEQAKKSGVNKLFTIGPLARFAATGFGQDALWFADQQGMIAAIDEELNPEVTLLVKGSRLMKMENIVDGLVRQAEES